MIPDAFKVFDPEGTGFLGGLEPVISSTVPQQPPTGIQHTHVVVVVVINTLYHTYTNYDTQLYT